MTLVGRTGSWKTSFIHQMIRRRTFFRALDEIMYLYQYYQSLQDKMIEDVPNIGFIRGVWFELIKQFDTKGDNLLLIFDDVSEELSTSKEFKNLATVGNRRNLNCLYIEHNLFHKSPNGRDAELQLSHIVLVNSPRVVHQIQVLRKQLGLGKQLTDCYKDTTSVMFGHMMIFLSPGTPDNLRFCTHSTSFPAKLYLLKSRARTTSVDDKHSELLYSKALTNIRNGPPKIFLYNCPIDFIRCPCECLRNFVDGNLPGIRRKQITQSKTLIKRLLLKKTSLQERLALFSLRWKQCRPFLEWSFLQK